MPFNQIDSTILFLQDPLRISKKIRWVLGECMAYYHIGYYHIGKNDLMKGVDYLFHSLAIAEKNSMVFHIARNNKTLGDAYARLGDYEKAEMYLKKSVTLFRQLKNKREELLAVNNLGLMFFEKKDYKASIPYFEYCLTKNKRWKLGNLDDIFLANLGASLRFLGEYDKALRAFEQTEKVLKNTLYYYRRILNLTSVADIWIFKNDFSRAKMYLDRVQALQNKYGTNVSQKDIYQTYYSLYKKMGDKERALDYYEKFIALEKLTTQQDKDQKIQNLQASFDNEKKNNEINLLNQSLEKEVLIKSIFIAGAILLLLFAVWFWRNSQKLSKQNKTIESQRTELQSVNAQLETLNQGLEQKVTERTNELQQANEALIKKNEEIILALVEGQTIERKRVASELHDNLGATLSAIKWRLEAINGHNLTDKERKIHESTLEMMKGAYSEVRLISHNLLPAELEKGGFKGALEKFITDINSSEKLHITYDLQSEHVPTDKKMQLELYSIALELLNNVLRHAKAKKAHVMLYAKNGNTYFEISDDGKGIKNQVNGMGTKSIQSRVQSLNGTIEYLPQAVGSKILLYFSNL
ncbi:tetratricopeptide repeat protein [Runella sp. SP2]|uniref:tetratricopeptide repeat-containing sensor histidine kinase n=1 Tax=Runella sp. SP2 TaxID=2268026 RepID=UPI0013DE36DC|nr:tetratricopeptide repeat protein [Runella sp. SP2]